MNWRSHLPLLPLILAAGVVPLLARVAQVPFFDRALSPFPLFTIDTDVFAWCKLLALAGCAGIALVMGILAVAEQGRLALRGSRLLSLVGLVLLGLTILSTVRSHYRMTALFGFPSHYEGLIAWASYLILFLFALHAPWPLSNRRALLVGLVGTGVVICVLCELQFYDLVQLDRGALRKLVFGALASDPMLRLLWAGPEQMTATLYNPNVVGGFVALLTPLVASAFLLSRTRTSWGLLLALNQA
jgi:hypothetical protein